MLFASLSEILIILNAVFVILKEMFVILNVVKDLELGENTRFFTTLPPGPALAHKKGRAVALPA
jgi:hypothetical protein